MIPAKQKFYSFVGLLVLVFCGLCWGFYWAVSKVQAARQDLGGLRQEIAGHEEEREEVRGSEKMLEDRRLDIERIRKVFLRKEEPHYFLEYLEELGAKTGSKIVLEYIGDSPSSLKFRVTADGKGEGVMKFLKLLEVMPFAASIDRLELLRTDIGIEPLEKGLLRLNIDIEVLSRL